MTPSPASPHLVAVIGLGIMGSSIARNLVEAGFRVTGFDLDDDRCTDAARAGASIAANAADAVAAAELLLSSLPSDAALDATVEAGTDLATRLLARLAQRGQIHGSAIARFGMSAGLQPAAQLGVVQERDLARLDIDHQCARGEVRLGLVPRERLREAWQKLAHLGEAVRLGGIRREMGVEQGLQGGWHHFRRDFSGDAWRTLLSARVRSITVTGTTPSSSRVVADSKISHCPPEKPDSQAFEMKRDRLTHGGRHRLRRVPCSDATGQVRDVG